MSILSAYQTVVGLPSPPLYTNSAVLVASTPLVLTVPTDENGKLANFVTISRMVNTDIFVDTFDSAGSTDRATGGTFTEVAANGTFSSDTLWTKGTGWTIAAGVATATGAISTALNQSSANIAVALIPGYSYSVTFTITAFTAGTIAVSLGGGTAGTARGSAATFTETIVAGSNGSINFATVGFTGSIDNVSVTPWILGAGWTTGSGIATATGAISTALSQTANPAYPLVAGQAYYVTYTVATVSAGTIAINIGGQGGSVRSTAATFSEQIIASSTQAISFTTSGFTGTIDNLSIIPAAALFANVTTGASSEVNPAGYFLNGTISTISIVSGGTPTISASFYK